jgi:hypothetical protein
MGMALPVVPRHVHDTLGQGTFLVCVVRGAQFISSILLGRQWAGSASDARGPKVAMPAGLVGARGVGGVIHAWRRAVAAWQASALTWMPGQARHDSFSGRNRRPRC